MNFVDPSGLATEFGDCFIFRYSNESGSCFGGNLFEVVGDAITPAADAIKTCGEPLGATPAATQLYGKIAGKSPPTAAAAAAVCIGGIAYKEVAKRVLDDS